MKKQLFKFLLYDILVLIVLAIILVFFNNDTSWFFINLTATISGIITVVLVAKKDIRNYYVGFISVSTYALVAFANNYLYDFLLYTFFLLPIQIVGFYMWSNHVSTKDEHTVEVAKPKYLTLTLIISGIIIFLLAFVFYDFVSVNLKGLESDLPYVLRIFDATTTVLTILAQIFMLKRYQQQWPLWIVVNILSIFMWIYFGNYLLVGMFVVYLINAIYGYFEWSSNK